jgi:hypothetical protein
MWNLADRIFKTMADVTVGTLIVMVHVTLADRQAMRSRRALDQTNPDGTRSWRSQISP